MYKTKQKTRHFDPERLKYEYIDLIFQFPLLLTGRQFDKDGNMMQWWNNATIEAFRKRAECIIDQYSNYWIQEVKQYMNGKMTQGENIADNGGLKQAFRVADQLFKVFRFH